MHVLLAALVLAQLTETITVNVVEVPVTVVDAGGAPLRGLTAANFKLFDQGKEVAVTAVDAIDFASHASRGAVSPLNPAARRKFMLVFDLSFSRPSSLARAQEAARQFVAKSVQPGDLVGVGTIDRRGFRLLAAFTTDRQLVAEAIADPGTVQTNDPLHLGRSGNSVTIALPNASIGSSGVSTQHPIAIMNSAVLWNKETTRAEVEKEMDFLGDVATSLRGIPGRKQLVLLSEGFDARLVTGTEAREDLTYEVTMETDPEKRFGSNSGIAALRRMTDAFRASDVVLHALDIQGVRAENDVRGAFVNSNESLRMLSQPTGGMLFKNVNKIESDFERMLRAEEVVYVLSFHAPAKRSGQFHELKVKLVDVPGGAKAFARAGYTESGNETAQERTLTNAEIIMNDVEQNDLRTASLAAAFPGSVPVIVEVAGADLPSFDFYVYAFDEEGIVRDRLYQRVTLDLAKAGPKLRANGLKYWATLALPPGKYAIKTLVTAGSKKGFTRTDVVVPTANQLAAAPIFIDENAGWVLVKGTSHAATAPDPFEHFIPAATARTKRFAIVVPNAPPEELTLEMNPAVRFLGAANDAGATTLLMELVRPLPSVDVTVRRKGIETPATIPLRFR